MARADGRLVAVGEWGHVLLSDDGGGSWRQAESVPTRATLTAVTFADAKRGWAVGHDAVVIHTRDGGETWELQLQAPEEEVPLLTVWFQNAEHGLAAGAFALMIETTDGGKTWRRRPFTPNPDEDYHLNAIFRGPGDSLFIAAEFGSIYRSLDGGASWERLHPPYQGSFWGGLAVGEEAFLVFGMRGHVFRSEDLGESWQELDSGTDQSLQSGNHPSGWNHRPGRARRCGLDQQRRRQDLLRGDRAGSPWHRSRSGRRQRDPAALRRNGCQDPLGKGEPFGWPLAGVQAIDLSTEIAGPYCTKMLVDAGAEVIKVEPPDGGDPLRRWTASGAPIAEGEDGALFQHLNASKRSVTLDLESGAGRETLLDLATAADLVVESFQPGELARLGLTFDALQARNPALSLVSISPWGSDGPWAERPATEFTLQAATGSTAHRGLGDREPVAAGGRIGEWIAGGFAAVGALFAWLSARNTGRGQHVDLSIFEAMLLSMTYYHDLSGQWREGPLPRGIEVPSIEPAKDGWVGFCTITGQQWLDFCVLIGQPELAKDERYLEGTFRTQQLEFMKEIVHGWTRERNVDEIIELASLMRIPVAPIGDGETSRRWITSPCAAASSRVRAASCGRGHPTCSRRPRGDPSARRRSSGSIPRR